MAFFYDQQERLGIILAKTGDRWQRYGKDRSAIQVFPRERTRFLYFECADYVVSSAVSGPSLILVPRDAD